nr:MAG TPA: AntA/AntB antirepressor [Caudoviricetes sp.]
MKVNVILSKRSSENEIKTYFSALLRLAKSDSPYPVNLDEVWPLVYKRRDSAIDALKRDFIENEDFSSFRNSPEREIGGTIRTDYYLTLSCLEYFIVKKVRPVFEVYRQVFHKTANRPYIIKRAPGLTTKVKASLLWVEGLSKSLNLNDASKLSLLKQVAEPLGLPTPDYVQSKGVVLSASELLKLAGVQISARDFNKHLIKIGYLAELTRPSSKGGVKKFKSIIGEGLKFGENNVNPSNPKETQPLWYEDKFKDLLQIISK